MPKGVKRSSKIIVLQLSVRSKKSRQRWLQQHKQQLPVSKMVSNSSVPQKVKSLALPSRRDLRLRSREVPHHSLPQRQSMPRVGPTPNKVRWKLR